MLRNYLTIAWRALRREWGYSTLNILGLAVGIAVMLVIALFIQHKLSFDRFHTDADRIYRIVQQDSILGHPVATVPRGLPHRVTSRFPEVETSTVLFSYGRNAFTHADRTLFVDDGFAIDRHFFEVFSFEVLRGSPERALTQPGQVFLTQSTARRIFGAEDPMGQSLTLNGGSTYRVAGIVADPPANSHLQFNVLFSLTETLRERRYQSTVQWGRFDYHLYAKTVAGVAPDMLQQKLTAMAEDSNLLRSFTVQPLTRIHLHTDPSMNAEIAAQSDVRYLYVFGVAGLLILGIAGANYVNLSTARALRRVREVGVRKTMGATRSQLLRQFMGESLVVVLLALPLALALAYAALPLLGRLTDLRLTISPSTHGPLLMGVLLTLLGLGLAAGSYPALVLSGFSPSAVLGGQSPMTGQRGWLRDGLVAVQFAIAGGLLLGTATVHNQMEYVRDAQLDGAEHIVFFRGYDLGNQYLAFKQELNRQPHVVSAATGVPLGLDWKGSLWFPDPESQQSIATLSGSADYFETMGLDLIAGRHFPPGVAANDPDTDFGYIVNETFAERYGISKSDIGATIEIGKAEVKIRGIVADFHNRSLHEPIHPITFDPPTGPDIEFDRSFVVRLEEGETAAGLAAVRAVWDKFVPSRPLDYFFLDDKIEAQYADSQRLLRVFGLMAGIALFVTVLGLLGLTAYMAERRTKEVGIRKAIGATAASIVWLFSKDTARLVGIGLVVGLPLAYLGAQRWLQQFAYPAEVGPGLVGAAVALVFLTALGAASVQSLRAARLDPAEKLRYE